MYMYRQVSGTLYAITFSANVRKLRCTKLCYIHMGF